MAFCNPYMFTNFFQTIIALHALPYSLLPENSESLPPPSTTFSKFPLNSSHFAHSPQVSFSSSQTLCDVGVEAVLSTQTQEPVKYDIDTALRTEQYIIA